LKRAYLFARFIKLCLRDTYQFRLPNELFLNVTCVVASDFESAILLHIPPLSISEYLGEIDTACLGDSRTRFGRLCLLNGAVTLGLSTS